MAAASLAKVEGVSLRDMFEVGDPNFVLYVSEVVNLVVESREDIAREIKRRSGNGR